MSFMPQLQEDLLRKGSNPPGELCTCCLTLSQTSPVFYVSAVEVF